MLRQKLEIRALKTKASNVVPTHNHLLQIATSLSRPLCVVPSSYEQ